SSNLSTLQMSRTWQALPASRLIRCSRSPKPVKVGVQTLWPLASKISRTYFHVQPPIPPPCNSTKLVIHLLLWVLDYPQSLQEHQGPRDKNYLRAHDLRSASRNQLE